MYATLPRHHLELMHYYLTKLRDDINEIYSKLTLVSINRLEGGITPQNISLTFDRDADISHTRLVEDIREYSIILTHSIQKIERKLNENA